MELAMLNSRSVSSFLLAFWLFTLFTDFPSNKAQLIPHHEVKALQAISDKLANVNWKVTQTSGKSGEGFPYSNASPVTVRNVTCDCTFRNGTVCHVTGIRLTGQSISGEIPSEFGNLTQLTLLDLTRNYLNGTIPKFLERIPLVTLSLSGNRISGSIPEEFGEIASLENLGLEDTQLTGPLPQSFGNLSNLRRVFLSANCFTGTIPETFGNLKNLTLFFMDGNNLLGKMPSFMGNWTEISYLDMQGTGVEGPIPPTISLLTNLKELVISDLRGTTTMAFPNLKNMKGLERLILRNCLITGPIPEYIGQMKNLITLDLSFNKLTGLIPDSLQSLNFNYMFLTNNSLSGAIPEWVLKNKNNMDLSYNNFAEASIWSCQILQVNLASSLSSSIRNATFCLNNGLPCPGKPQYYSLFINCGGPKMEFEGNEYEEDLNQDGISYYYEKEKWAYSSTGTYMYSDNANYIASLETNKFSLNVNDSEYYKTARLSPQSLKYYGLCMMKGNYKVKLHFADIMFSNDQKFSSLGTRIFDVSIQGIKYLKDFNIAKEAGGVGKGITKEFDVDVNDSTLEIHLYWAGKGTSTIPNRGVYGPLISVITVAPNFKLPSKGLPIGVLVAIVVGSCTFIVLVLIGLQKKSFLCGKDSKDIGDMGIQDILFSTILILISLIIRFKFASSVEDGWMDIH